MRSFTLSIFATLAFAVFSYAAPMPNPPPNVVAARHDEHTKDVSLEVVFNAAIEVITPITVELGERWSQWLPMNGTDCLTGCIKANNATLEVIAPIIADL